jgi:16S rRNA (uracil1498-N3)-methyltransferase
VCIVGIIRWSFHSHRRSESWCARMATRIISRGRRKGVYRAKSLVGSDVNTVCPPRRMGRPTAEAPRVTMRAMASTGSRSAVRAAAPFRHILRLSSPVGWTAAMACLLGAQRAFPCTEAFSWPSLHHMPPSRRFHAATDLSAKPTQALTNKGGDLDPSKLPRLFIGNTDRTKRYLAAGGLAQALQDCDKRPPTSSQLRAQSPVTLNEDQSHYLTTVLRLGKKSKVVAPRVRLFDESGEEWLAEIMLSPPDGKRARHAPLTALCLEPLRQAAVPLVQEQPRHDCWLVVAPTKKKDRLRWMVEKCTELNVAGFLLLDTDFSEAPTLTMSKLQAYAVEAAEQCERLTVPHFVVLEQEAGLQQERTPLSTLLEAWQADKERLSLAVCRERSSHAIPLAQHLSQFQAAALPSKLAFLVGPEGGWSAGEEALLDELVSGNESDVGGMRSVSLGSTILRSETAAMLSVGAFALFTDGDLL